jgi:ceramide glucosyltransferase
VIGELVTRAWVLGYAAVAVTAAMRAMARSADGNANADADKSANADANADVVLVRPLAGEEVGLARRLMRTGGAPFVIFAVGSRTDPAEPIAQRVAARLRAQGVVASVALTGAIGPNHKADQLARALDLPRARLRGIVVVADSDVELAGDEVARLVGALGDAALVWAPPVERGRVVTWGDHASQAVLDASLHSFPLLAAIDPRGMVGKLFAVRRPALDAAGGFADLVVVLGEDMELARRLSASGYRIAVAPHVACAMGESRDAREIVRRFTRWLLVVRAQRAHLLVSYPLLLAPSPLFAIVLAWALARDDAALATIACSGLAVRLGVACLARVNAGLPLALPRAVLQSFVGDLVLLVALVLACSTRSVSWRGRQLVLGRHGVLRAASPSGRQHANERTLRERAEPARTADHERLEPAVAAHVDTGELARDAVALQDDGGVDVALRGERAAQRDPQLGLLASAEHVPETDGHDQRLPGDARDLRGAGTELERSERRALSTLGEDPYRASGMTEEPRGMPYPARTVRGIVEIDAERADATEERYASQVRRIHHRVAVAGEDELGDVERDERVPPRRVIRDEEDGRSLHETTRLVASGDEDATERAPDPCSGVTREPGIEPAALGGLDHEVTS